MYIAIEGVKGIGKSTLIKKIQDYLTNKNIKFDLACPTKPIKGGLIDEWLLKKASWLFHYDVFKELIYAHRSNLAAKSTDWKAPLVIGDRSIITSYVTRLWKYQNPVKQIARVDTLEPLMPAPDIVIYLQSDLKRVLARIRKRISRNYGKEDETPEKIIEDNEAYKYIMNERPTRLTKTKWIIVDANENPEKVFEKTIQIIETLTL